MLPAPEAPLGLQKTDHPRACAETFLLNVRSTGPIDHHLSLVSQHGQQGQSRPSTPVCRGGCVEYVLTIWRWDNRAISAAGDSATKAGPLTCGDRSLGLQDGVPRGDRRVAQPVQLASAEGLVDGRTRQPKAGDGSYEKGPRRLPPAKTLRPSGRQDLNLRPLDPQSSALPSCATSRPRLPRVFRVIAQVDPTSQARPDRLAEGQPRVVAGSRSSVVPVTTRRPVRRTGTSRAAIAAARHSTASRVKPWV